MTISTTDIKLMKSQVLLDTPDGGGAQTSNEVVDGASNNLFPDVSSLDRVYGFIALRKLFLSVVTTNVDTYFGARLIVSKKPQDPKVNVCLFSTNDWFDRRVAAKDRVERYLARGPKWAGHVLETQLTGQRAIQQVTRVADQEPKVGQGLALTYHEGLGDEREQYVRVTKVSSEIRTFTVNAKDIERKVLTLEISDPLRYDFQGPTVAEFENDVNLINRANLRDTRVANAATYYGMSQLAAAASLGDIRVKAESIFTQLVPASQSETALIDLYGSGLNPALVRSGDNITHATNFSLYQNAKFYIGSPVLPGTLTATISGNSFTEAGGVLKQSGSAVGTIEYDKGLLSFTGASIPTVTGTLTLVFKPAANPAVATQSANIHISAATRGNNYTMSLSPIPAPGSAVVSYMAQGKVYYLYDGGDGLLRGGDAAFGAGSVNFTTGTVLITLGVLPDVDSDILFSWGVPVSAFVRSGITVTPAKFYFKLNKQQATPGSVVFTWTVLTVAKTATDNGLGGFTGDATGLINYASGELYLTPATLPQVGTVFNVAYQYGPPNETTFVAPARGGGGYITVTLPNVGGAVIPGSVELDFNVDVFNGADLYAAMSTQQLIPPPANLARSASVKFFDKQAAPADATGSWQYPSTPGEILYGGNATTRPGSVTYATRVISFIPEVTIPTPIPVVQTGIYTPADTVKNYAQFVANFAPTSYFTVFLAGVMPTAGTLKVKWRTNAANTAFTETFTGDGIRYDLTPGFAEDLIIGAVRFVVGPKTYVDRAGSLYHSINPVNGSGTFGGTVQYQTGVVTLSDWPAGASNALTLQSLATQINIAITSGCVFRIPIAPVRPGSIQVRAVPVNGTGGAETSATLDGTGNVVTANIRGVADYTSGVVTLNFGAEVQITAGNRAAIEAKPWYAVSQEYARSGNQYIFEPKPVYADTIRYNAVGYTYLPLSGDILGLDPVRLPQDGRVPIFRTGSVVVVHNTAKTTFPSPVAGATLNVGRVRCSEIRMVDNLGAKLPESMYTPDVDAGTITLGSSFSTAGYASPFFAEHRIEDESLVTDVQINGQLTLSQPLTHAYSTTDSGVSSALIIGNMQGRVYGLFSQQTWTNVWSDAIIGPPIIAQYNDVLYPITNTNKGSLEEQWAMIFTSNTSFRVVGRSVGQITNGDTATNLAPLNPAFGVPYFSLNAGGWGGGWAAGNVFRFNTGAANHPAWLARTVLQGPSTALSDKFEIQKRGDIDRV